MSRKHRPSNGTDKPKWEKISVESGYGYNTRLPFVHIHFQPSAIKRIQEDHFQLDPNEARDLAANLLQAAEASEQDGFIVEFMAQTVPNEDGSPNINVGANILVEFRKWRNEHGQNK